MKGENIYQNCPSCNQELKIPKKYIDQEVIMCPVCDTTIVPNQEATPPPIPNTPPIPNAINAIGYHPLIRLVTNFIKKNPLKSMVGAIVILLFIMSPSSNEHRSGTELRKERLEQQAPGKNWNEKERTKVEHDLAKERREEQRIKDNKQRKNKQENKPSPPQNSAWNNSVYQVRTWLDDHLKDPKSFDAIEWSGIMSTSVEDAYAVRCQYRSKNGFGGYVVANQIFYMEYNTDGWSRWEVVAVTDANTGRDVWTK